MANETSSYQTYLMTKGLEGWEKLVDIKNYPDLQGDPNLLDVTTLSDDAERQINGIKRATTTPFTINYTLEEFKKLEAIEGKETEIAVYFGADETGKPDGHVGMFEGVGIPSLKITGKDVDGVREAVITFAMVQPFKRVETASA